VVPGGESGEKASQDYRMTPDARLLPTFPTRHHSFI
jgi:hypothetical protein